MGPGDRKARLELSRPDLVLIANALSAALDTFDHDFETRMGGSVLEAGDLRARVIAALDAEFGQPARPRLGRLAPPRARARPLRQAAPHIIAELRLYGHGETPRTQAVHPGFGCQCYPTRQRSGPAWDCLLILQRPMEPGETRTVGFVFDAGADAVAALAARPVFHLWERGFIGEARIERIPGRD